MGMAKEWDEHSTEKDGECSLCEPKDCETCGESSTVHTKTLPAKKPLGAIETWEHCQECGHKELISTG